MTSPAAGAEPARTTPAVLPWLGVTLVGAVLLTIYLGPFVGDPDRVPSGLDTPGYVWRARAVSEQGLDALPSFRDRPGHPVLVSVLRDVTGATPLDLARIWPALIATGIGLATLAVGTLGLREDTFGSTLLAIGVAASAFIAVTAIGYAANLLVDLFVVAALALALHARAGGDGSAAIAILVVAAAVTHWLFAALLVGLLIVAAVTSLVWPPLEVAPSEGRRAARRLLAVIAIASTAGALALLLAPSLPTDVVAQTFEGDVDRRIERRMPPLAIALTLPAAAAGAIAIAVLGDARRRRSLPVLGTWAAIAPAGLVAWYALHLRFPPYRTAAVALGVPALIVLGAAVPAAVLFERGRRAAAIVVGAVAIGAATWLAAGGTSTWWGAEPAVARDDLAQAVALDRYLRTQPPGTIAVVPLPQGGTRPPRILRLGMEASHADAVRLVPADLSAGTDAFVEDVLRRSPDPTVVVFLDAYRRPPAGVGEPLGPGITLVHGAAPEGVSPAPPSIGSSVGELLRTTAVGLALLIATGLGWALALARVRMVEALAIAPALGAAVLVVVGLVAGRLGLSYAEGGGTGVAVAAAAVGWIGLAVLRTLGRRSETADD